MWIALTRAVSANIHECELTHLERVPIDFARASAQHEAYERRLAARGCTLVHARTEDAMADAVFVEDAAVVVDEVAVITRPGAESRRGETDSVAEVLERYRPLRRLEAPATLDGGDVLRIGRTLYAGRSERTNDDGIDQLRRALGEFGYRVEAVDFQGALHLKTAATQVAPNTLLVNPAWVDCFGGYDLIEVDPEEPFAGNALLLGDTVLYSASFPRTRARLEARGIRVETVDVSELEKAEAGVTCCSIVIPRVTRDLGGVPAR